MAEQTKELNKYNLDNTEDNESPPDYNAAIAIMATIEADNKDNKASAPPIEEEI